jgi:hypothetical protein
MGPLLVSLLNLLLFSSHFALNSALKSSINRHRYASIPFINNPPRMNSVGLQGRKVVDDTPAIEVIKKTKKNRKRWNTDDIQREAENISKLDVLQIALLYKDVSIPPNVRASLSVTELALLNDISVYEGTYPEMPIPDEFKRRSERVKAGGELMGNDLEKKAHQKSLTHANSVDAVERNQVKRSYFDPISSSHICTSGKKFNRKQKIL